MARIRTIKPEFWTDEAIVECSRDARLLFIGIWNHADDAGVIESSIKQMKMKVFPGDFDIMPDGIQRMIDELSTNNLIEFYDVENRNYIKVLGWDKHQRIDRPSYKHPLPSGVIPQTKQDYLDECSTSATPRKGMEGKGREGKGRDKDSCAEPSQAKSSEPAVIELPTNRNGEKYPVTQSQVSEYESLYPLPNVLQEIRNMKGWLLSNPAKRKTRNGMPRFITSWLSREQNKGGSGRVANHGKTGAEEWLEEQGVTNVC